MCKLRGMKKLWTMPCHPQINGLVERSHQTIMQMIWKLGEDEKVDWPGHMAEIVHAYNTTSSTVMGYSPHYLMFGHRPRLPVDFYFPILRSTEEPRRGTSTNHVNEYITTIRDHLRTTLQEAQAWSMVEAQRQKWYYDQKVGAIGLKPGDPILVKADAFQRKRMIKDRWEDKPHEVVCQIATDIPSYEVKDQHGNSHPTSQPAPPHYIRNWCFPMCGCLPSMGWMYQPHPSPAYSWEWQQDNTTRRWWSGDHTASG